MSALPVPESWLSLIQPPSGKAAVEAMARQKIAALDREAKAAVSSAESALLFYEAGRLWEDPLNNPRNAAIAYQNAHRLAPKFLSNIRAARRLVGSRGNLPMVGAVL